MIHQLFPSTRAYIFICAGKSKTYKSDPEKMVPPLSMTHEMQKKRAEDEKR
jgi:hypothetical protein